MNSVCLYLRISVLFTFLSVNAVAQIVVLPSYQAVHYHSPLAVVSTATVGQITAFSAKSGGNVISEGSSAVSLRGVVWSDSGIPSLSSYTGKTNNGNGLGAYPSTLTNLTPLTTYYVRAYATNGSGTAYGQVEEFTTTAFTCGDNVTFFYFGAYYTYGTVSHNGKCWFDRNLGAGRVPGYSTDTGGYGDLFQWGRLDDYHQQRYSGTTSVQSSSDIPGHDQFITNATDWRNPRNDNLWKGVNGINNPCPAGWRVPTFAELSEEVNSWSPKNASGAFNSPLRWTLSGTRNSNGALNGEGTFGNIWSSSIEWYQALRLHYDSSGYNFIMINRADGMSVRCIKDY